MENSSGQVSDIAITMFQNGYINKDDISTTNLQGLKNCFGADFYVETNSEQVKFVHASIWQYFLAEQLYDALRTLSTTNDTQCFIDKLARIVVPEKTIDKTTLSFIKYFSLRDSWKPASPEVYKHVLIHMPHYTIHNGGNVLDWISCILRETFKLFTQIFEHHYPEVLQTLFQELSSDESRGALINCSNLSSVSPFIAASKYVLNEISLNRVSFAYSHMRGCRIRYANFRNANFDHANASGAYADHGDFSGSSFRYANISATTFEHSKLICCDFSYARVKGADFSYADVSYSDFRTTTLSKRTRFNNTILNHCKISLSQIEFFNVELIQANNMHVYTDENIEMTYKELAKYYYEEKHPTLGAFRKCSRMVRNEES